MKQAHARRQVAHEAAEPMAGRGVRDHHLAGHEPLPASRFIAGETPVEPIVFPARIRRRIARCQVDGRPMRRAKPAEVAALVEAHA